MINTKPIISNSYKDSREMAIWTLLFLLTCSMFLLSGLWQTTKEYEALMWVFFSFVVLCPVLYFIIKIFALKKARISVPLMMLGIFFCICYDPLKYYLMGERIKSPPGFPEPTHEAFSNVGFFVSLFCLMALVVISVKTQNKKPFFKIIRGPQTTKQILIGASVMFVIGLVPFVLLGGESISFTSIFDTLLRGRSGGGLQFETTNSASITAPILVFGNAMIVSGLLAAYGLVVSRQSAESRVFLFFLFIIALIFVASGGGRTKAGFLLFPTIILLALKVMNNRKKKYILLGCFMVLFTTVLFIIQLRYRDKGWLEISQDYNVTQSGYSNDLCSETALIVSHFPNKEDFLGGDNILERIVYPLPKTFFFFIANPIPRTLWPGKPSSPSWAEYNYLRTGSTAVDTGSNVTPTVIGRYYMEYGIPGLIQAGLLMGFLWRLVDRVIINNKWDSFSTLIACLFAYYLLQSTRDLWPGWLYPVIFLVFYGIAVDMYNKKYGKQTVAINNKIT